MDKKVSTQQLAEGLAKRQNIDKKNSEVFVRTVFEVISEYLTRDKLVKIKGIGTFKMIEVSDRESINVNTGERIRIAGHPKVTFTPDPVLRDQVNKPFAAFETVIINDGVDVSEMEKLPEEDEMPQEVDEVETEAVPVVSSTVEEPTLSVEEQASNNSDVAVSPENETPADVEEQAEQQPISVNEETTPVKVEVNEEVPVVEEPKPESSSSVIAESKVEVPVEQPIEEQSKQTITEEDSKEEKPVGIIETADYDMDKDVDKPKRKGMSIFVHMFYWLLIIVVAGLAYFAGTRQLLCTFCPNKSIQEKPAVEKPVKKAPAPAPVPKVEKKKPEAQKVEAAHEDIPQMENGDYIITGTKAVHKFAVGDNLWKLAKEYYGDKNLAPYIIFYNQFPNPDNIFEGTEVKIPELQKKE